MKSLCHCLEVVFLFLICLSLYWGDAMIFEEKYRRLRLRRSPGLTLPTLARQSRRPIRCPPAAREKRLAGAGYNLFKVPSEAVFIDLSPTRTSACRTGSGPG